MLQAFDRVSAGGCELLLSAGYAGVGKTTLVHEIHMSIVKKNGYFIEGKFDQLQRNVPYFAWIQAFTGFVNYILMESETHLVRWKENIIKAVGSIGKVLTDVIPNLELIIGKQPDVPSLGATEAQNRFNYVFLEFIKTIATSEHSLTVFIDDLQWIDTVSFNLMQNLMTDTGVSNILLIGAYRDNEVDSLHPLSLAIETLRKEKIRITELKMSELSEYAANELIADILHRKHSEAVHLTHLLYSKTGGNPLFLLQTLKMLVEKQVVFFNVNSRSWDWDTSAIERLKITDNVVVLMVDKIRQLDSSAQYLLQLAACIGFKFSISNLSIIVKQSEDAALQGLQPALREGLIVAYDGQYQFVHDRIQQAAYSLIPEDELPAQHLQIGRLLSENMSEDKLTESIFEIVGHLNRGSVLISDPQERIKLAKYNLAAGRRAKAAAAFSLSVNYFEICKKLLPSNVWETNYNLISDLILDQAESEYLIGKFMHSEELLAEGTRSYEFKA